MNPYEYQKILWEQELKAKKLRAKLKRDAQAERQRRVNSFNDMLNEMLSKYATTSSYAKAPEYLTADEIQRIKESMGRGPAYDPFKTAYNPYGTRSEPAWCKVLELPRSATKDEIKTAYRKLALKHHPDKGGDSKQFNKINEAYKEAMR